MRFFVVFIFTATAHLPGFCQYKTGNDLLREMHRRYFQAPCKAYTFSQRNTHYENDTAARKSVWHEAVEFPDKFRITFGEKNSGNFVLFRNDSVLRFRQDKFIKAETDSNNLLLLLGGMYYRTFDDASARLKNAGYDLSAISEQSWRGKPVYVIGAKSEDTLSNQFWVNKTDLVILRIIEKMPAGELMDMRFENYQKWCKGHVENRVSFRRNGKLEQEEEYFDLKVQDHFILKD
jgi:hypothetical protein